MESPRQMTVKGSSPRGRGKRQRRIEVSAGRGLIPARAGKTSPPRTERGGGQAHPRAGGENEADPYSDETLSGSSPRGRGKRRRGPAVRRPAGLIPARAGKTWRSRRALARRWVHPRAGGENHCAASQISASRGSSPRGRGKPGHDACGGAAAGLIPARAGKTTATTRCRSTAHPRAGGENVRRLA